MNVFTSYPHSMRKTKQTTGFTIVELLIVIVVIAILAAISIVAYNGIQNRAKNTAIAETASRYGNGLMIYSATYGEYPGGLSDTTVACLDGTSSCWSGSVDAARTTTVTTALKKVMNSLPSFPESAYNYSSGWGYYIAFILADTSACPSIGGATLVSSSVSSNKRLCRIALPSIT